tara:strand:+ start:545 stop:964 length:420 start_codon:yes stop_codon:yes gene_type:complete
MSVTPQLVISSLENSSFYQNQAQFWPMLQYIVTTKNDVIKHLSVKTCQQLAIQLHLAIESATDFNHVNNSRANIYHTFFIVLRKIRGTDSVQTMMFKQSPEILKALHNTYKILFSLETPPLPTFGTFPIEVDISSTAVL